MRFTIAVMVGFILSFFLFFLMTVLIDKPRININSVNEKHDLRMLDLNSVEQKKLTAMNDAQDDIPKPEYPTDLNLNFRFTNEVKKFKTKPIIETLSPLTDPDDGIFVSQSIKTLVNRQNINGDKYVIYPERALVDNIEGSVLIENTIDQSGRVVSIQIIESFPVAIFDTAVRNSVKKWKYKAGGAVRKHRVKVDFVIDNNEDENGHYKIVNRD